MSNPNGLLSQKLCHCLNQGRTLNGILMRATHWGLLWSYQIKFSLYQRNESLRILNAMVQAW